MSQEDPDPKDQNDNPDGNQDLDYEKLKVKFGLEKEHRKNAEYRLKEAEKKISDLAAKMEEADLEKQRVEAEKTGNYSKLKESFDQKKAEIEAQAAESIKAKDAIIESLTKGVESTKLASRLFGDHAELLGHVVDSRLGVDHSGDKPQVVVLDAAGNQSANSLDDLYNEIYNDKRYSPFVVGSKASGGGANGSGAKGGGANLLEIEASKMTESQRLQLKKEHPDVFQSKFGGRRKQ